MAPSRRLEVEIDLLDRYFPGCSLQDMDGGANPGLVGRMISNAGVVYTFFADLEGYPDVAPKLYILQPILRCHDGSLLSELGTSSTMHVLAPNDHGHVQVCHYNDRFWRSSLTLYKVLMKSRVWLEAYERHLRHGEPVEHYLGHM